MKVILREFRKEFTRKLSAIVVSAGELARLRRRDKTLYDNISKGKVLWDKE